VGKVTFKTSDDEVLSDDFFLINAGEALSNDPPLKK
jgi:hypothetical protein